MGIVIGDVWTDRNQNGRVAGVLADGAATRTLHVMPGNVLEIRTLAGQVLHRDATLAAYPGFVVRSLDGGRGDDGRAVVVVGGLMVDSDTSRTLAVQTDYRLAAITTRMIRSTIRRSDSRSHSVTGSKKPFFSAAISIRPANGAK